MEMQNYAEILREYELWKASVDKIWWEFWLNGNNWKLQLYFLEFQLQITI